MCAHVTSSHASGDDPSRIAAREGVRAHLVRTLEQMRTVDHRPAYDAVRLLVDTLLTDGFTPEATVITVKSAIEESACLMRFERPVRERVRVALVATCIDRYFEARESLGGAPASSTPRVLPRPEVRDAGTSP
jgi:hypothetical protein